LFELHGPLRPFPLFFKLRDLDPLFLAIFRIFWNAALGRMMVLSFSPGSLLPQRLDTEFFLSARDF